MDTSLFKMSGEPSVVVSRDPIIRIGSLVNAGGVMTSETTVEVNPLSYGDALQGSTASLVKVSCRDAVKATTGLEIHLQQP